MGEETTMNEATVIAMVGIIAACLGGNGFWQWLMTKRKKKTPTDEMVLALGRERLNFLCKKHLSNGEIPEDEYESFKAMGEAYIGMGGNSMVKKLFEECDELDIERKE